jgi:methyl-accepting chemotaxis protein
MDEETVAALDDIGAQVGRVRSEMEATSRKLVVALERIAHAVGQLVEIIEPVAESYLAAEVASIPIREAQARICAAQAEGLDRLQRSVVVPGRGRVVGVVREGKPPA